METPNHTPETTEPGLRYLTAEQVDTPLGRLTDTVVVSPSDETLGNLEGIVISPAERQARYFVVASRGVLRTRRYLLPISASRIDAERHTVRVSVEKDEMAGMPQMRASEIPRYSEDDLLSALFSSRVA